MSKKMVVAGMALFAGLAICLWFWRSSGQVETGVPKQLERGDSSASSSIPAAPADVSQDQALPSLSAPLKDALPRLKELAERGNSRAQCRIATEIQKCMRARRNLAFSESYIRGAEARKSESDLNGAMIVFGRSSLESELAHCEGVDEIDAVEVAQFLRRSARSGNREAMLRYAAGAAFDMGSIIDLAEELQAYKRDAIAIARKAAAGGDGRAVIALASAYSPDSHIGAPPLLAQVTGEDVAQSLALFMYADRSGIKPKDNAEGLDKFVRGRIDSLKLAASPDQIVWAERQASELARTWAAPRLPSGNERAFLANAQVALPNPEDCEQ